jgi:hypothetical protein
MVGFFKWMDSTSERNKNIVIICLGLLFVVFICLLYKFGLITSVL